MNREQLCRQPSDPRKSADLTTKSSKSSTGDKDEMPDMRNRLNSVKVFLIGKIKSVEMLVKSQTFE